MSDTRILKCSATNRRRVFVWWRTAVSGKTEDQTPPWCRQVARPRFLRETADNQYVVRRQCSPDSTCQSPSCTASRESLRALGRTATECRCTLSDTHAHASDLKAYPHVQREYHTRNWRTSDWSYSKIVQPTQDDGNCSAHRTCQL